MCHTILPTAQFYSGNQTTCNSCVISESRRSALDRYGEDPEGRVLYLFQNALNQRHKENPTMYSPVMTPELRVKAIALAFAPCVYCARPRATGDIAVTSHVASLPSCQLSLAAKMSHKSFSARVTFRNSIIFSLVL